MLPELIGRTDPQNYELYLQDKISAVRQMFQEQGLILPEPAVYASQPEHYRMRCEFGVYKEDNDLHFVMYVKGSKPRQIILTDQFAGAHPAINQAMQALRELLRDSLVLRDWLFEADFLCAQSGETVIALQYHKKLDDTFAAAFKNLHEAINARSAAPVSLIARARKQQLVAGTDYVTECYHLKDKDITLRQVEGTFSQPNAGTCTHMLNFARACAAAGQDMDKAAGLRERDLLELYCGSGTFTVALADLFPKVLATEVARVPTETALHNLSENKLENVRLCRLSASEAAEALSGVREFRRLRLNKIDIHEYDFGTLLVDPPRSGIADAEALAFASRFDRIIYISCGPKSLAEDLKVLTQTHDICRCAFFDQFPYTSHLESGVLLVRKNLQ